MSDIRIYPPREGAVIATYEQTLRRYIKKVLNKIGERENNITWYICEEGKFPNQESSKGIRVLEQLSGVVRQPKYGMTTWAQGDKHSNIYISTLAIMSAPLPQRERLDEVLKLPKRDNLLVNVILDELAHAKTHKGHGSKEYDNKLKEYDYKYYDIQPPRKKTVVEELIERNNAWLRKPGIPWKI